MSCLVICTHNHQFFVKLKNLVKKESYVNESNTLIKVLLQNSMFYPSTVHPLLFPSINRLKFPKKLQRNDEQQK